MLEIKVRARARTTTLARSVSYPRRREKTKLPLMRIIDQYMGYLHPLVLVIAR